MGGIFISSVLKETRQNIDLLTCKPFHWLIILYIVGLYNFKKEHSKVWLKMEIITIELLGCGIAEGCMCSQSEISFQLGQPSDPQLPLKTQQMSFWRWYVSIISLHLVWIHKGSLKNFQGTTLEDLNPSTYSSLTYLSRQQAEWI